MQHIIFSTYDEKQDGSIRIGDSSYSTARISHKLNPSSDRNLKNRFSSKVQELYAEFWKKFDPEAAVSCERTIEGALHQARQIGELNNGMQTLITGSLHLVSGALYLLEPDHSL